MTRLALALLFAALLSHAADQRFADIGDLALENGQTIEKCRVGYRTYGTLNAAKSNAILWPTWFGGTTANLEEMVGPGRLADSSSYFVITADALGNGVSSSPSNSPTQPDRSFPRFTIGDMVEAHYRLVTEELGIERLHAVIGISMGGMQTFEWMVAHPGFMKKAVPMVGSTRQTSMDLLLWGAQLGIIEAAQRCGCGRAEAMRNVGMVHSFALETPAYRVRETPREEFSGELMEAVEDYGARNDFDWASQLRAMMATDVARNFDGVMERAAGAVMADTLVVAAAHDHMVNPAPALEFAELLGAETLILESDCGHRATGCEAGRVAAAVNRFLK